MTLTTQQNVLKLAHTGEAAWNKAVVFATYQPALYQNELSEQKIRKKSAFIDSINLEELSDGIIKLKPKSKSVKKRKTSGSVGVKKTTKRLPKPAKARVIRAKKTTPVKKKKSSTATVIASETISHKAQASGKSSSFTSWLKGTRSAKAKAPKKTSLSSKIKKSTKPNQLLVTEPIAEQLARQGYNDQAIKMYEQLRLIIPEKSSYFAALISKLKKEI